jgi:hypothetical protein
MTPRLGTVPVRQGDIAKAKVLAELIAAGKSVLLPFSEGERYDLVIDDGNCFRRVQAKLAWSDDAGSTFLFNTSSFDWRVRKHRGYAGEAELFGVYYPGNGRCYLVPVEKVREGRARLRLLPTRNGQSLRIKWAHDYEFRADSSEDRAVAS